MERAGAKPPPACRTPRTTARRPKRTARPTPRRARLGAPQNVAGSRATGTPADRQGLPTPAGRPTARQGRPGRPPRFCGGWRAPGPRAARELTGADPKRRGRTPTKPPPHHTPPRGQRRGGASRAIRIRGGARRARLAGPGVAATGPHTFYVPAAAPGQRAARRGGGHFGRCPNGRPASAALRLSQGAAAAKRQRRRKPQRRPQAAAPVRLSLLSELSRITAQHM